MSFLGYFNIYCLRVNLSVALVAMVKNTPEINVTNSSCPYPTDNTTLQYVQEGEFDWSTTVQGQILGAFFYGFFLTQLPGGRLAEYFDGKLIFGLGVFFTAFFTVLTPVIARWNVVALIVLRILEGLSEGITCPAMHYLIGSRIPKFQRSTASTFIYSGALIGTVVSLPVSGIFCSSEFLGGWPAVFYVFGGLGCVWTVFWFIFIPNRPLESVYKKEHLKKVPWIPILKSRVVWILAITHFGQGWGFLMLLTELPTYLSAVLHYDIQQNALFSAIPYLFQSVTGWFCGFVADYVYKNGYARLNVVRKTCNTIGLHKLYTGYIGTALCLIGVVQAGCDHLISISFFTLAMSLNGFINSGFFVSIIDIAPDFAGTLVGITATIAAIPGFLAPIFIGYLTEHEQTVKNWSIIYYFTAGLYILTNTIYVLFGTAELQPWGVHSFDNYKQPEDKFISPPTSKDDKVPINQD
ncbi:sialin-like [Centruroides sculpturatus]|uniref:sialin-like n=1 Tax=Centruroides sculpturatus TaxID=218467 RepID=UPI000C6E32BF|nr:sialin-like [Centruroides sculpturatus]